jgi:hypothetical protein
MIRLVIGALLSAVVLFAWGFLFWVVSPLRNGILRPLPGDEAVIGLLEKNLPNSGVYVSPFPDENRFTADPKEAREEFLKRQRQGPRVQISYRKGGVDPMSPAVLGLAFGHFFVSSLLIGGLLLLALPGLPTYTSRMVFVFLAGVFAAVTVSLSAPVWFHQPWDLPLFNALYHASGWFVASFVLAAIIRPRKQAPV